MIEPGRSGHRNRVVARDAARQVSTKKNGFRLTWILTTINGRQPAPADAPETPLRASLEIASTESARTSSAASWSSASRGVALSVAPPLSALVIASQPTSSATGQCV